VLTIREIVAGVASAEAYYRRGLRDGQEPPDPGGTLGLDEQRELLLKDLLALSPEDRGRRFQRIRQSQTAPEHWTARKVIRRVIAHERFHTAEIRQRLAWLQLGVPVFPAGGSQSKVV
jgi:hypothetical protein